MHTKKCVYAHWPPALTTAAMSIDQCCHSGVSFEYFPTLLTLPPFIQTFARTFFIYDCGVCFQYLSNDICGISLNRLEKHD